LAAQIYWDDGTEPTEMNDTTTNSYVFTHQYSEVEGLLSLGPTHTTDYLHKIMLFLFQAGKYRINITAFNLHSNELYGFNKYITNMTRY
jgi:hypothetical protein